MGLLGLNIQVEFPNIENNQKTNIESQNEERKRMTIGELGLTIKTSDCLKRANINTVSDLIGKTSTELAHIRYWKPKYTDEIVKRLAAVGLCLREET